MGSVVTCRGGPRSGIWTRRAAGGRRSRPRSASSTSPASPPLSERLARRGRIGAEELTELLNRVFGTMLGAGLRARRRPAEVRGRRAPAAVRQPGPRRAGRQRRGRPADCAARGRGGPDVGRSGGVAHVRRHPQRDDPPVPGRAEPPRAAHRRAGGDGDDRDGARRRAGPDRRQPEPPGRPLPPRAVDEPGGPGSCCAGGSPRRRRSRRCPLRPVPKEVVARYLPPALRTHLVERSTEPEHRVATIAFLRFSGVDALMAAKGPDAVAEALDEVVTAVQDAADGRRGHLPRHRHRRGRRQGDPGHRACRPQAPTTRGGWSAASAGSPTAACRCRSRSGSTGATSSSVRSAWPTARRSRSWATP